MCVGCVYVCCTCGVYNVSLIPATQPGKKATVTVMCVWCLCVCVCVRTVLESVCIVEGEGRVASILLHTYAHMHTCTHAHHMHSCTHAHIHTCTHAHSCMATLRSILPASTATIEWLWSYSGSCAPTYVPSTPRIRWLPPLPVSLPLHNRIAGH